jgi:Zn-dependent peptidase ImmA (M78 family)/predicted secreted protein
MPHQTDYTLARLEGSLEAARELQRLGIDQSQLIDVFRVIVEQNIWLLFQPLDRLLGAYLNRSRPGIVITTLRSRSVQRLTAAHEYGHHVLHHSGSADDSRDIDNYSTARRAQEASAQAFATDFLMPPVLVNTLWDKLGIPPIPTPNDVYQLSLQMGTSYQATVYQLQSQDRISQRVASTLKDIVPKRIKRQIGGGLGPGNPWAEVWPIDAHYNGQVIAISLDDELRLSLPEQPSTGYLWAPERADILDIRGEQAEWRRPGPNSAQQSGLFDEPQVDNTAPEPASDAEPGAHLGLVRSEYETADATALRDGTGTQGHRYLTLRALRPGVTVLRVPKVRPWERNQPPIEEFLAEVHILDRPTGRAGGGYLDSYKSRDIIIRETTG